MITLRKAKPRQTAPVAVAQTADDMSRLQRPDCAALVWDRRLEASLQNWINALPPESLPRARVVLHVNQIGTVLDQVFDLSTVPGGPERQAWASDVIQLANSFCAVMDTSWLRLRFDRVTGNACRKFHVDAVTARLVCTYRGTGTQYTTVANTDDPAPDQISTTPTSAPILLRGTLWPPQPKSSLRHRSPPIEGTGETRSVLVLDPVQDPDDGPDHGWCQ